MTPITICLQLPRQTLGPADLDTWLRHNGFSEFGQTLAERLDPQANSINAYAVLTEQLSSPPPAFDLTLEINYSAPLSEGWAVLKAFSLYEVVTDPGQSWRLPAHWGMLFRHKGAAPDILLTPENITRWREYAENKGW